MEVFEGGDESFFLVFFRVPPFERNAELCDECADVAGFGVVAGKIVENVVECFAFSAIVLDA